MSSYIVLFVKYIFPIIILLSGIVGNFFGCVVMWRKQLEKIGPQITYKLLFISDTLYLLQILVPYIQFSFGLSVILESELLCKICNYFNFSLAVISPMLVSFISIDRYISIKYPAKRFSFRTAKTQIIFYLIVVVYNSVYYLPVYFLVELKTVTTNTTTNKTSLACQVDSQSHSLIFLMDTLNRVVLPFALMLVSTILLIHEIFKSRTRIVENFLAEENKTFYHEIRLATTSICLNLIYILLNLPISLIDLFPSIYNFNRYIYFYYLFYFSYAMNAYILLITNTLFQNEFFILLKIN